MDNALKLLYTVMGIIIFMAAIISLTLMSDKISNAQRQLLYDNVDWEVIRVVNYNE